MAKARQLYGLEKYQESAEAYAVVPRFSKPGLARCMKVRGLTTSRKNTVEHLVSFTQVTSPYFTSFFIPEAYVIQGITYFVNYR